MSARVLYLLTLFLSCAYVTPAWAQKPREPQSLLLEAIKAQGGEENLAKTLLMTRKATGVMSFFGRDLPFSDELVVQLPDRWRWTLEGAMPGQNVRVMVIVNGTRGWQSNGGPALELTKERLDELREETYLIWLASLVPLLKEKGLELETLPDAQVNGQAAAVLKVSSKGHTDVKLFFEKQSRLLVKAEHRAREAGQPVDKEYFYAAHKAVEGVLLPTKYMEFTNGKKLVEVSSITYKFHRAVDERTFVKP
jgi:hypothetical protein